MNLVCIEEEERWMSHLLRKGLRWGFYAALGYRVWMQHSESPAFPQEDEGIEKFRVEERSEQHDKGRRTAAFSPVKGRRREDENAMALFFSPTRRSRTIELTGMPQKKFLEMRLIQQWVCLPENTGVTLYWILSGDGITHHLSDEHECISIYIHLVQYLI